MTPTPTSPPVLDIAFATIGQFDQNPAFFDAADQAPITWWSDGQQIYWRDHEISADPASFVCFNRSFAKDQRHCFMRNTRLAGADVETFKALNACYAVDRRYAWTLGGRFEPADIQSFEVCDAGLNLRRNRTVYLFHDGSTQQGLRQIPNGYARDAQQVYVYDFWGKTKLVKSADPASFVSNGDSIYGRDRSQVFYIQKPLKGADPRSWQLLDLDEGFSRDARHIYRNEKCWPDADADSFTLQELQLDDDAPMKYPKDKNSFFLNTGERVTLQELEQNRE